MNRTLAVFLVVSTVFAGCRTVRDIDFVSEQPLANQLPPLEVVVDIDNLKEQISPGSIRLTGYYDEVITKVENTDTVIIYNENFDRYDYEADPSRYHTEAVYTPDPRVRDFIKIVSSEFNKSDQSFLNTPDAEVYVELLSFESKQDAFLTFLTVWTLGVPALVGFPVTVVTTNLEVQMTFTDASGSEVGKFSASAKGSAPMAMYWGFGKDAKRKSAINAMKNALKYLKTDIEADRERLYPALTYR